MVRAAALLLVASGASACAPFSAVTPDSDAGPAEAGTASDASAADGAAPGPDAPGCSAMVAGTLFCEDFDTVKPDNFGFTDSYGSPAAFTAKRIAVAGRGSVLDYSATISSGASGGWFRFAPLTQYGTLDFNALELSMAVAVIKQTFDVGIIGAFWTLPAGGAAPQVNGVASLLKGTVLDGSTPNNPADSSPQTLGKWQVVRVRLERSGSTFTRSVLVDGRSVDVTHPTIDAVSWDVRIGTFYGDNGTAEIYFDDVRVTRE